MHFHETFMRRITAGIIRYMRISTLIFTHRIFLRSDEAICTANNYWWKYWNLRAKNWTSSNAMMCTWLTFGQLEFTISSIAFTMAVCLRLKLSARPHWTAPPQLKEISWKIRRVWWLPTQHVKKPSQGPLNEFENQIDPIKAITDMTCGKPKHVQAVIEASGIPALARLLKFSPDIEIQEHAVWTLVSLAETAHCRRAHRCTARVSELVFGASWSALRLSCQGQRGWWKES